MSLQDVKEARDDFNKYLVRCLAENILEINQIDHPNKYRQVENFVKLIEMQISTVSCESLVEILEKYEK